MNQSKEKRVKTKCQSEIQINFLISRSFNKSYIKETIKPDKYLNANP